MPDTLDPHSFKDLVYLWQRYIGSMTVFKAEMRPQVKHLRRKEAHLALDMYTRSLEEYARAQHPEHWD